MNAEREKDVAREPLLPEKKVSAEKELEIEEFAFWIDNKKTEKIREVIDTKMTFRGYSALAIAGMHTHGAWVLDLFGTAENLNAQCSENLHRLAEALQLEVDEDILNDTGFTPLMLAVMFGPPTSVDIIVEKVGDAVNKTTRNGYNAKRFADCRQEPLIQRHFRPKDERAKRGQCDFCEACTVS